jgi:hypothetical protein
MSDAERQALLDGSAKTVGDRWAQGWRDELRAADRPVAGGWPGTLGEARALSRAHLSREIARLRATAPTPDELERTARATYARARAAWLSFADAEDVADLEV